MNIYEIEVAIPLPCTPDELLTTVTTSRRLYVHFTPVPFLCCILVKSRRDVVTPNPSSLLHTREERQHATHHLEVLRVDITRFQPETEGFFNAPTSHARVPATAIEQIKDR